MNDDDKVTRIISDDELFIEECNFYKEKMSEILDDPDAEPPIVIWGNSRLFQVPPRMTTGRLIWILERLKHHVLHMEDKGDEPNGF